MWYDGWVAEKRISGYMPIGKTDLDKAQTALNCILRYIEWLDFKNTAISEFGPFGDVEYEFKHSDGRAVLVRHSRPLTGEMDGDIEIEARLPSFHVEDEPYQAIGRYLDWAEFKVA
jgi:hypothetical protein